MTEYTDPLPNSKNVAIGIVRRDSAPRRGRVGGTNQGGADKIKPLPTGAG